MCEFLFVCVHLNGATGPRLHNEARPFAVTPPHQGDREAKARGEAQESRVSRRKEKKEGGKTRRKRGKEWRRGEREEKGRKSESGKEERRQGAEREKASVERGGGRRRGGKGAGLEGGGISERGLRMVQPKNRENGEKEGAAVGERERVGP